MATKKKLICAEDLFNALRDDISINGSNLAKVRRHIEAAPAVDAVEVVRCRDCKHYLTDTLYCQEHKTGYCTMDDVIKDKAHFCSYGERREGNVR